MAERVDFIAQARQDLYKEWSYLHTHARSGIEDAFLAAVNKTTAMLADFPHAGTTCNFRARKMAGIRRFPVRLAFDHWTIFYMPEEEGITVHRIVHGARDLPGRPR